MTRPTLADPSAQAAAETVARDFAATLQRGGDTMDADEYDRWFADDVLWGSPYGLTLTGFAPLNSVHQRLMDAVRHAPDPDAPAQGAPASVFEVVTAATVAPGVVVTQIRRAALVEGGFSELALYVLVERDGGWWLAAAQNTPVRPAVTAD
ncbi:DUF4440 domain-containing protein [Cryptosporangium phraense]|uniref:DUF4440 domain-containing protein n=1 Tax=Cryptosporangium phraense TaxID=2593070 RepID=A0A545AIG3_9ACTN|nr:DUF4440 domain-containing protein [Cryptosporangium phraense]TQS41108.1 DUF4440 domain-containing protein [Cryptosporangium phraense]